MKAVALQHKYLCSQSDIEYSHKEKKMKKFWKSMYCFFELLGRARAASKLANAGNHELAKRIIMEESDCCRVNNSRSNGNH